MAASLSAEGLLAFAVESVSADKSMPVRWFDDLQGKGLAG